MKCDDCNLDFPSNYLKPFTYNYRVGAVAIVHTLQLCKTCLATRKSAAKPIPHPIGLIV